MDNWVTLSKLSRKLHYPDRILKDGIAFFHNKRSSFKIKNFSYGMQIVFHENQTFDSISNILLLATLPFSGPLCIAGVEWDIRYFYSQYFTDCYANFEWPFEMIDEPSFVNFFGFYENFKESNGLFVTVVNFQELYRLDLDLLVLGQLFVVFI